MTTEQLMGVGLVGVVITSTHGHQPLLVTS